MGYFVFGLSHKECPIGIREKVHFTRKQIEAAYERIRADEVISEFMVLSTCNRVEFYGYSDSASLPEDILYSIIEESHPVSRTEISPFIYIHEGKQAIHHAFRVAAGLDSLVVGESEILGQLRDAFKFASDSRTVHSLLYRLMEKALKTGKDVRSQTKINEGAVSIPSVGVELAEKIFGRLAGEKVMVLGTGEMSMLTLKNLADSGARILYVVSRDEDRGRQAAGEFGAEWISYDAWPDRLESVDILIASTSAPHVIVTFDKVREVMQARKHRPLFLIDIAVPRNIEAHVHTIDDVYLYNIDDLKGVAAANLRRRRGEIQASEAISEKGVESFASWLEQLKARPALERFENYLNDVLEAELCRLSADYGVSEDRKNDVRNRIRNKLLHAPIEVIKDASRNGGVKRYVEALQSLFHLDKKSK